MLELKRDLFCYVHSIDVLHFDSFEEFFGYYHEMRDTIWANFVSVEFIENLDK